MKKETVLWGCKKGESSYMEQVLCTVHAKEDGSYLYADQVKIDIVQKLASKEGFDRFRIAEYDLSEPPDFREAINQ